MSKISRREILARGGQVAAIAAVLPVVAGAAASDADDLKLLDMWKQAEALEAKGNSLSASDDEVDRLFAKAMELQELIVTTPAVTALGIAIKLRVAVNYEALDVDVVENPQLVMPRAIVNALADAERLAGRAL